MSLNYWPSNGGLQAVLAGAHRALQSDGWSVSVLTFDALNNPASHAVERIGQARATVDGVDVIRSSLGFRSGRWVRRSRRTLGLGPSADPMGPLPAWFLRQFWAIPADVVIAAPASYLHVSAVLGLRRLRRPLPPVILVGALHVPRDRRLSPRTVHQIRACDHYVALTPFEREVVTSAGCPPSRVTVIPPAVVDVPPLRHPVRSGPPTVLYFGRQAANKGIETLLRAVRALWEEGLDVRFVIAGEESQYSKALRAKTEADLPPPWRSRIAWHGRVTEAERSKLYADSDVFVSVSAAESFGIVFLEAWAFGTPVIGADIPAVRSVINHEHDGIVVPPEDARALAAALRRLVADRSLREAMGRSGHARVQREFNTERFDNAWRALLRKWSRSAGS